MHGGSGAATAAGVCVAQAWLQPTKYTAGPEHACCLWACPARVLTPAGGSQGAWALWYIHPQCRAAVAGAGRRARHIAASTASDLPL